MVQRTGVGLDSLDLEALRAKGIPLYVNQGVNAQSVAEHTLLLILACLRRLPQIHRNTANGIWICCLCWSLLSVSFLCLP